LAKVLTLEKNIQPFANTIKYIQNDFNRSFFFSNPKMNSTNNENFNLNSQYEDNKNITYNII
jgi:hypothetical protein